MLNVEESHAVDERCRKKGGLTDMDCVGRRKQKMFFLPTQSLWRI